MGHSEVCSAWHNYPKMLVDCWNFQLDHSFSTLHNILCTRYYGLPPELLVHPTLFPAPLNNSWRQCVRVLGHVRRVTTIWQYNRRFSRDYVRLVSRSRRRRRWCPRGVQCAHVCVFSRCTCTIRMGFLGDFFNAPEGGKCSNKYEMKKKKTQALSRTENPHHFFFGKRPQQTHKILC